jgi:hypothetical protein
MRNDNCFLDRQTATINILRGSYSFIRKGKGNSFAMLSDQDYSVQTFERDLSSRHNLSAKLPFWEAWDQGVSGNHLNSF